MPKTPVPINFQKGINTKTDPFQLPIGEFQSLQNTIFTKQGMLQKRNGFSEITSLPNTSYSYLTTLNDNLTAIGQDVAAFNESTDSWISKGSIQPVDLSVLPLIRNSIDQTQCDAVAAENGLVCVVYTETNASASSGKYAVLNSTTGQNIVAPTPIPPGVGVITGSPRVFLLGNYFVIVFTNEISSTYHLQYIAISTMSPTVVTSPEDIAAAYTPSNNVAWDGLIFNNNLYIAYNTTSGGQSIKVTYLPVSVAAIGGAPSTGITFTGYEATTMSLCIDTTVNVPLIYLSFYNLGTKTGYITSFDSALNISLSPLEIILDTFEHSYTVPNIASAAMNSICYVYIEVQNQYSYDSTYTNFIYSVVVQSGGSSGDIGIVRGMGLGSKAFIVNGIIYFLGAYGSEFQSSYFLINATSQVTELGQSYKDQPLVVAKLAYENGGGYLGYGLPGVTLNGNVAQIPYLFADLIEPLATVNNTQQTTTGGVYAQTGINFATFDLGLENITSVEIANGLQIGGGFGWLYDGLLPVEQNFFVYPENIYVTTSTSGGSITAQEYYYQVCYRWVDAAGNVYFSAASVPFSITTTGSTSTNTINVPYLRITYKIANPPTICVFRWSTGQEIYYQLPNTEVPNAILNETTADSVAIVDTYSDAEISGGAIIYTTGGVVEDINPPATNILTIFDTRVWAVDSEDPNLEYFSKQIIEATPVEWSDLLTEYVAPNSATVATTGPITAHFPMDDKIIIFKGKGNAIYYINGTGPDNTGANSAYNGPIFITSSVSCTNQDSLVMTDAGLMFQSNKGIWLLPRGIAPPVYIGAPVEAFNSSIVQSAVTIPMTTQVRFTLNTGETLMYDYFFQQWGVFEGVPAVSSCLYQGLHSFINKYGAVYQETPGVYLDGANSVLMSFKTGWINVASLTGFERFHYLELLGRFLSPCQIQIQIAYDYVDSPVQSSIITPDNFSSSAASPYGDQPAPFGSPTDILLWQVHAKRQKCTAFQITLNEIFDPTLGAAPGAGFTLSGITLYTTIKNAKRPIRAAHSVG
jgi:hypothetical protein